MNEEALRLDERLMPEEELRRDEASGTRNRSKSLGFIHLNSNTAKVLKFTAFIITIITCVQTNYAEEWA